MYREFVYMDADRVQSVIAQLKEGLLTQIVAGKENELQGRARLAAGVLSHLFPIGLEGAASHRSNLQSSKVLHDYAYAIALEALQENDMLVDVKDDWDRDELPLPDNAFVLVRGDIQIMDYSILHEFAEHEDTIDTLFGNNQTNTAGDTEQMAPSTMHGLNREQRRALEKQRFPKVPSAAPAPKPAVSGLQQVRQFMDTFMGDTLLARALHPSGLTFTGPLVRTSLREDIRHYILKRGGAPQEGWAMLGQVSLIPDAMSKLVALSTAANTLAQDFEAMRENPNTALDMLNLAIGPLYQLQEAIASISYPAIAITPIAIYRELGSLR